MSSCKKATSLFLSCHGYIYIYYIGRAAKVKGYSVEKVNPMTAVTMRKRNRSRAPVTGSSKLSSVVTSRPVSQNKSAVLQPAANRVSSSVTGATTTPTSITLSTTSSSTPATPPLQTTAQSRVGGRSTYSLKQRVIHILAIKPQNRESMVTKLKKGMYVCA